jgi:hypothetical protein
VRYAEYEVPGRKVTEAELDTLKSTFYKLSAIPPPRRAAGFLLNGPSTISLSQQGPVKSHKALMKNMAQHQSAVLVAGRDGLTTDIEGFIEFLSSFDPTSQPPSSLSMERNSKSKYSLMPSYNVSKNPLCLTLRC